jgi:hypothetical protein
MFLIGIGNQTKSTGTVFTLLADKIIGYTLVPISGGSSYYTIIEGSKKAKMFLAGNYKNTIVIDEDGNYQVGRFKESNYIQNENYHGVVKLNDKWLTYGDSGSIQSSSDFINWTIEYDAPDYTNHTTTTPIVAKVGDSSIQAYRANNNNKMIEVSTDGINWTTALNGYPSGLNFLDGLLAIDDGTVPGKGVVAGVYDDKFVAVTPTGQTYHHQVSGSPLFDVLRNKNGTPNTSGLVRTPYGQLLAFSNDGKLYYNSNIVNGIFYSRPESGHTFTLGDAEYPLSIFMDGVRVYIATNKKIYTGIISSNGILMDLTCIVNIADSNGVQIHNVGLVNGNVWFNWRDAYTEYLHYIPTSMVNTSTTISSFYMSRSWNTYATVLSLDYANGKYFFAIGYSNVTYFVSTDLVSWQVNDVPIFDSWVFVDTATINTLKEVQISIGNQGSNGTAEQLIPINIYTVPSNKHTSVNKITLKNNSSSPITFDMAVTGGGNTMYTASHIYWDQAIAAHASFEADVNLPHSMQTGESVTVLPSSVNALEVKVYGDETNVKFGIDLANLPAGVTANYATGSIRPNGDPVTHQTLTIALSGQNLRTLYPQFGNYIDSVSTPFNFTAKGFDYVNNQISYSFNSTTVYAGHFDDYNQLVFVLDVPNASFSYQPSPIAAPTGLIEITA